MADKEIKGVIVPILTPLKSDETVDVASLRRLVNYLIDNGVHGIWVSGTTGEFANLSDKERLVSMDAVVDEGERARADNRQCVRREHTALHQHGA